MEEQTNHVRNNRLDIYVRHVDSLVSDFSYDGNMLISSEFITHFEEAYLQANIPPGPYTVNVAIDHVPTEGEQIEARKAFKNHYIKEERENNIKLRRLNISALVALVASVMMFVCMHVLEESGASYVWTSVLEVAAWVFSWQFMDNLSFSKVDLWLSRRRNKQALNAKFNLVKMGQQDRLEKD